MDNMIAGAVVSAGVAARRRCRWAERSDGAGVAHWSGHFRRLVIALCHGTSPWITSSRPRILNSRWRWALRPSERAGIAPIATRTRPSYSLG